MRARLVRLAKRLEKPFLTDTNLTLEKNLNGEAYLARLNSIQIDRLSEQTEKEFVEVAQIIALQ